MMSRILYLILHFALNEFVSGCIEKKNIPVNQIVTKRTAHPPSFETCQMCGSVYKLLIFKRLKNRVHPEVNSVKMTLRWLYRG